MNVLKFVFVNWHDILVILVLIASGITGIIKWIKVKGPLFNAMSDKEKNRICYEVNNQPSAKRISSRYRRRNSIWRWNWNIKKIICY